MATFSKNKPQNHNKPKPDIILLNPSSGNSRAIRHKKTLEGLLEKYRQTHGLFYKLYVSKSEQDFRQIIRRELKNAASFSSAGGDSSFTILVNEVIRSGAKIPLGVIPLGSSDDIARQLNIKTLEDSIKAIALKKTLLSDAGKITAANHFTYYFPGQANIGLGAYVNDFVAKQKQGKKKTLLNKWLKNQTIAGLLGIYRAFKTSYVPLRLSLLDPLSLQHKVSKPARRKAAPKGNEENGELLVSLMFSKIKYWVGGLVFLPQAELNDGQLHAFLILNCGFWGIVKILLLAMLKKPLPAHLTRVLKKSSYVLKSEEPFMVQVDGDIIRDKNRPRKFSSLKLEVAKKKFSVFINPL